MVLKRCIFLVVALLLLAGLALACGPSAPGSPSGEKPYPKAFVLGTPSVGGALQIYGSAVAALIEKYTKVVVSPQPCTGAAEATELLVKNEAAMAAINGHNALSAYTGIEPFKKTPEIIRGFTGGYKSYAHFIVRADSGIKSIADLKGRRLMFDRPGEPIFQELYPAALAAYGLKTTDVTIMPALGYKEAAQGLTEKTADATLQYSAIPSPQFLDMAKSVPILILPIEQAKQAEILKKCPYLVADTLKGGVYNGTPTDTPILYVPAWVVIRADLPEQFAYDAIKAVCSNITDLQNSHAMFKGWTPKDLAGGAVIPYHAGVFKYYKEVGALTPDLEKKHADMLAAGGQKS